MSDDRSNLARKYEDVHHEHSWAPPPATILAFKRRKTVSRIVDVFDGMGDHIAAYTVSLDDEDCLACEFEEVALVLAEQSGRVAEDEMHLLVARCHRN